MKRKKLIATLLIVVITFIISFFLIKYYPKSLTRLPLFLFLLLTDIYLWKVVCNKIKSLTPGFSNLLTFIYWFPFAFLLTISITGLIYNYTQWNSILRSYFIGVIIIVYISKFVAAFFLAFFDMFRLFFSFLIHFFRRIKSGKSALFKIIPRKRQLTILCIGFGLLLFLVLSAGVFKGVYNFKVKEVLISLSGLPKGFDGFKIVQISDFHLGNWLSMGKMQELVSIVNRLHPDIILFTGDVVNYRSDEAYPYDKILSELKSNMGVYCILGNHDYGDYFRWKNDSIKKDNMTGLENFYKRIGWKLLKNENQLLIRGKDTIALIGVENWGSKKRFRKKADMIKALKGLNNISTKLLMSHDPSHWDMEISVNFPDIDITFSGHTHGMQFGIETKKISWSPVKLFYKYWSGLYSKTQQKGKIQYLYVNTGLGNIVYPGRVGITPEITLFTLQPVYDVSSIK